ncbi:MAG: cytochrome C oxidase subunit IV family protein [Verrucomicrobiales bacterium]|nr:cytochrome C oxidase subunit IV family protein [Verrucomicrobiales bacterium]MCP5525402.1 cytochrome C oxidase subunit IV family protein [Verrucomicrobiales bacterium]
MHEQNAHDVKEATRKYIYVFVALLLGTVITVIASFIHFGNHAVNIGVALFIASCKAFLVAGYFMHLISERKLIYGLLGATGIFFVGLMGLIIFANADQLFTGFR